jgi:hypothetical protein
MCHLKDPAPKVLFASVIAKVAIETKEGLLYNLFNVLGCKASADEIAIERRPQRIVKLYDFLIDSISRETVRFRKREAA